MWKIVLIHRKPLNQSRRVDYITEYGTTSDPDGRIKWFDNLNQVLIYIDNFIVSSDIVEIRLISNQSLSKSAINLC